MERSIGFERTIKPKDYESLKVTSSVNNIPLEYWQNPLWIEGLYQLMITQSYKAIFAEDAFLQELREQKEGKLERIKEVENGLLELLALQGITVNTNVEK